MQIVIRDTFTMQNAYPNHLYIQKRCANECWYQPIVLKVLLLDPLSMQN